MPSMFCLNSVRLIDDICHLTVSPMPLSSHGQLKWGVDMATEVDMSRTQPSMGF